MNRDPLISVLLPVYNGESHLAEAIDSILSQTLSNFELIIIDDGSTDRSLELLKKYEAIDERIILVSRPNKNLVRTLNESIDMARGKWVARMDQDDISIPTRFQRQIEWAEQSESNICGSWVKFFSKKGNNIWKCYESHDAIKIDMLFRSPLAHPAVIMHTDVIKKLRYDVSYERAEDYDLWVRAALAGYKFTNVPEVLLLYRQHNCQISSQFSLEQQMVDWSIKERYWEHVLRANHLEKKSIKDVLSFVKSSADDPANIEKVNYVFTQLFKGASKFAKSALTDNVSRLYLKNANFMPNIKSGWGNLNKHIPMGCSPLMSLKLELLGWKLFKRKGLAFKIISKMYKNYIQ